MIDAKGGTALALGYDAITKSSVPSMSNLGHYRNLYEPQNNNATYERERKRNHDEQDPRMETAKNPAAPFGLRSEAKGGNLTLGTVTLIILWGGQPPKNVPSSAFHGLPFSFLPHKER